MITPESASQPMTPEAQPGGSYIPQQPAPPGQAAKSAQRTMASEMARGAKGQASDVDDFDLTMAGIAYGDPVGMETFDLGFFDDGTPGIVINGANVPIRHDQWMALLAQRNKMRDEIRSRMEFDVAVRQGRDAIGRIIAGGAELPPGAAELLLAQVEIDPAKALDNASRMYTAMSSGRGREMTGSIAADLQKWRNGMVSDYMLRSGPDEIRTRPKFPGNPALGNEEYTVKGKSRRDNSVERLRSSKDPKDMTTLLAYEKLEDFMLDPTIRQAFPTARVGIFDRISGMENDKYSPVSLFERLRHIASNHGGDFGDQYVPLQSAPESAWGFGSVVMGIDPANKKFQDYLSYLTQLDEFAVNAFGYERSSRPVLEAIALDQMNMAVSLSQQQAQQTQQQQQPQPQAPRSRQSAVR